MNLTEPVQGKGELPLRADLFTDQSCFFKTRAPGGKIAGEQTEPSQCAGSHRPRRRRFRDQGQERPQDGVEASAASSVATAYRPVKPEVGSHPKPDLGVGWRPNTEVERCLDVGPLDVKRLKHLSLLRTSPPRAIPARD
jgi:hypothetical protein